MPRGAVPAKNVIFKDLDLDFDVHPNTKNLNFLTGDRAVGRAIKHLVMTNFYERPFHPEIGSEVRNSLFDNIMPSTAVTIQKSIIEVVENYEPRAKLHAVEVHVEPDKNAYAVEIVYSIINEGIARRITFFLERIR